MIAEKNYKFCTLFLASQSQKVLEKLMLWMNSNMSDALLVSLPVVTEIVDKPSRSVPVLEQLGLFETLAKLLHSDLIAAVSYSVMIIRSLAATHVSIR